MDDVSALTVTVEDGSASDRWTHAIGHLILHHNWSLSCTHSTPMTAQLPAVPTSLWNLWPTKQWVLSPMVMRWHTERQSAPWLIGARTTISPSGGAEGHIRHHHQWRCCGESKQLPFPWWAEDLIWSVHTNKTVKKSQQRLLILRRLKRFGLSFCTSVSLRGITM